MKDRKVLVPAWTLIGVIGAIALSWGFLPTTVESMQVRVLRWLTVRQMNGRVTFQRTGTPQPAALGTRLQAIGDEIRTYARASATLAVDTDIGFIKIAERTRLQIVNLQAVPDGGRITQLQVTGGQARLQLRPFTHRSSRLNVTTPAGISGVRGTEFGVTVQPDGKTGVAVLTGSVETLAQGQAVIVNTGTQNLMIPGEPPQPPTSLKDNTGLDIIHLYPISDGAVSLKAKTDPVNIILVNDVQQTSDRTGKFETIAQIQSDNRVRVTIITPLGKRQVHQFNRPR